MPTEYIIQRMRHEDYHSFVPLTHDGSAILAFYHPCFKGIYQYSFRCVKGTCTWPLHQWTSERNLKFDLCTQFGSPAVSVKTSLVGDIKVVIASMDDLMNLLAPQKDDPVAPQKDDPVARTKVGKPKL